MSDNKPVHPGFEISEQFFEAFRYPPVMAARIIGMQAEVFGKFLDGVSDLNEQQAKALEDILNSWRKAGWILSQQEASKGLKQEVSKELEQEPS